MEDEAHPWQCCQKGRGDLAPSKVACGQDEYSRFACSQGANLQRTISQPLILREHNPAACSDRLEPDTIFLVPSEMVVVNLDGETRVDQFRSDWLYAQRPVDKEYGPIRRPRSGWLLRSHWSPDGSPAPDPPPNRPPCTARRWLKQVCRFRRSPGVRRKLPDS